MDTAAARLFKARSRYRTALAALVVINGLAIFIYRPRIGLRRIVFWTLMYPLTAGAIVLIAGRDIPVRDYYEHHDVALMIIGILFCTYMYNGLRSELFPAQELCIGKARLRALEKAFIEASRDYCGQDPPERFLVFYRAGAHSGEDRGQRKADRAKQPGKGECE